MARPAGDRIIANQLRPHVGAGYVALLPVIFFPLDLYPLVSLVVRDFHAQGR